jgi:hypothetical protein
MLSILKNKENIATQILNQFDVDYDLFRQELGMVKSNDTTRAEYQEENEEILMMRRNSQVQKPVRPAMPKAKRRCWIISAATSPSSLKAAHSIPSWAVSRRSKEYRRSCRAVKRTTRF